MTELFSIELPAISKHFREFIFNKSWGL